MQMDDQDLKSQLREERHKVKALRKIIRDYELKIVQLSHQLNTLKDKLGPRNDKDSSKEEIQEAVIRELMNTIEDLHKTIEEKDNTISQLTEEIRNYKLTAFDQQPPSSLEEGVEPLFGPSSTSLSDSESIIILDDDTIQFNAITRTTATATETENTANHNNEAFFKNHMLSPNRPNSPPTNPSNPSTSAATSNDVSYKSQKLNAPHNHVTTIKNIKPSISTSTNSGATTYRPSTSSNISFHSVNTAKRKLNNNSISNNNSHNVNSNGNGISTSNLIQTTLDNKISSQSTSVATDNKKRKIPNSLLISSSSTASASMSSASTSKLKQVKITRTHAANDENVNSNSNSNNNVKEYAFVEHARSKHERSKMVGNTCTCCQDYYRDELPLRQVDTNKQLTSEERIQLHSRHRTKYEPPKTPPGFWELDFPSFDEDFGKF